MGIWDFTPSDGIDKRLSTKRGINFEALGTYSPDDFVVRLRRDLHQTLQEAGNGVRFADSGSWAQAEAFSTYLHETVHWWQHVGTTTGLMMSFMKPATAHAHRDHLLTVLKTYGPIKSLVSLNQKLVDQDAPVQPSLNWVLNYHFDFQLFYRLLTRPVTEIDQVVLHPYFMSPGHSYAMAIQTTNTLLSWTVDRSYSVLPPHTQWVPAIDALKTSKLSGWDVNVSYQMLDIGALEILEGQARMSQLQYLYGASGGQLTWDKAIEAGYLDGEYGDAFRWFLERLRQPQPNSIDHPLVGLFLVVCELALMPSEGILHHVIDPSCLIESTDAGWRFASLTVAAREAGEDVLGAIKEYSAQEYWRVSDRLSESIKSFSPSRIASDVAQWSKDIPEWHRVVEEGASFRFGAENLPLRVIVSRFTQTQRDRLETPQFFCWPGILLGGARRTVEVSKLVELIEEHQPLFTTAADLEIYPRIMPGRDVADVHSTFDTFFAWLSIYELVHQWVAEDGPFHYDFKWAPATFSSQAIKEWADELFRAGFKTNPDDFKAP